MTIKFIHTADIHLGRPFSDLSMSDDKIELCNRACENAFNKIVELAIQKKVDFVLIAGDSFDDDEPDLSTKLLFINNLKKLADNNIKSYIICGNHDPISMYKKYDSYFKFDEKYNGIINIVGVTTENNIASFEEDEYIIHSVSFETNESKNQTVLLSPNSSGTKLNIGLMHCDLDKTESDYAPCSREDLRKLNYNYYALGHIHIPSDNNENIVYSGSPQGRTRKETGTHGCWYIEAENNSITNKEFLPVDCVRFKQLDIDCYDYKNKIDVFEAIDEQTNSSSDNSILNLFEINLIGITSAYEDLNTEDNLIEEYIENYNKISDNIRVYKINNETIPGINDTEILNDTGIIGLLANSFNNDSDINIDNIYDTVSDIHENIYKKLKLDNDTKTILSSSLIEDKEEILKSVEQELKSVCKEIYLTEENK